MKFHIVIITLAFTGLLFSDSTLPSCKGPKVSWNNCIVTYDNGDRYAGEFLNGERHGRGTYGWKSGETISGDWVNGARHGYYRYEDAKGNVSWDYWWEDKKVTRDQYYDYLYPDRDVSTDSSAVVTNDYSLYVALFILALVTLMGFLIIKDKEELKFGQIRNLNDNEEESNLGIDNQVIEETNLSENTETQKENNSRVDPIEEELVQSSDDVHQNQLDVRRFLGLSLKGWSFIFVVTAVAFEISGELYSLSQGYSLFSIKKSRFNIMETQHAFLYWAGVLGAIYLVVDYLKPKITTTQAKNIESNLGSTEKKLHMDETPNREDSLEDRLSNLKELFDKGLISKEVYESKQLDILEDE